MLQNVAESCNELWNVVEYGRVLKSVTWCCIGIAEYIF